MYLTSITDLALTLYRVEIEGNDTTSIIRDILVVLLTGSIIPFQKQRWFLQLRLAE